MKKLIIVMIASLALAADAAQYSKLSLITAAKQAGIWPQLKSYISEADIEDEWNACQYLADGHPLLIAATNALVSTGMATTEQVAAILAASVDSAISDEAMARAYAHDMKTAEGRVRWHGKVVSTVVDTNALTRTRTHEDGYQYIEKFNKVTPPSLSSQLSAAERQALRDAAAKKREEAAAAKKAARIAELQTNMVALATQLAAQKQYPYVLAEMLLQNELNKLIGTNVVDAVIKPEN